MNVNESMAYNLRQIRHAQGMSLDVLAKESGVSKSMLGQIERGEVNPTVSVLSRIACGLKTSVEQLLLQREDPVSLMPDARVTPVVEEGSTGLCYRIFPYDESRRLEIFRVKLLPGMRQVWPAAVPGTVKYFVVTDGQMELTVGERSYTLHQFDAIRFMADCPHSCRNAADRSVNLMVSVSYSG